MPQVKQQQHSNKPPEAEGLLPGETLVERDGKKFVESIMNKPGDEKRHPDGVTLHVAVRVDMDRTLAR